MKSENKSAVALKTEKIDFSCMTAAAAINQFEVDESVGLNDRQVAEAQARYGKNELQAEQGKSFAAKLIDQLKDFTVIVLIIAALVSGLLNQLGDAILIIAIVIVNAVLGIIQEGRAEKSIAALQKMSAPSARVLRNGQQQLIASVEVVPGDIVLVDAGTIVPADIRLLSGFNLKAEEAALTGESVPVEKDANFLAEESVGIGDRANMLYSGTSVTYGSGTGLVVAIGEQTEVGKIADRLKGIKQDVTPLQRNLNKLGKVLGMICLLICALVFVIGFIQGGEPLQLFLTAVSLAVAAIPEGLPAVVTIVLALGMNRMARKNAIVKKLPAVETLGSIDTICSDKTGTLTQNEMTVTNVLAGDNLYRVTGTGYSPEGEIVHVMSSNEHDLNAVDNPVLERLVEIAALCNEAELVADDDGHKIIGDPTEGALLTLSAKLNLSKEGLNQRYQLLSAQPFDSERKMMTVTYAGMANENLALTKGAPDIMLERSSFEMTTQGVVPMTEERRAYWHQHNANLANQALRVLAYAYEPVGSATEGHEEHMIFVGLTGMIDPARPEVKEAIKKCQSAGIRPVMITGDYPATALAIAKELGLADSDSVAITGREIEAMDDEQLREKAEYTSVYARVSPEHKVRIVSALRDNDHIASMTGDGVNDAPALKQADIGVAMGITGTEVSKSASDMILTDDNFSTIVSAVEEGRIIYSNIRKFVGFLLSCNMGEILVVFLTTLMLGPNYAPLLPIQLLWLNLVTDSFPALALGQEKGESSIMSQAPRKKQENIINKEMILSIAVQSIAIFVAVFTAFQVGRYLYPDVMLNAAGEITSTAKHFAFFATVGFSPSMGARTFAFVTLIIAELLRAFTARSEHQSVFKLGVFSNRIMNRAILISTVMMLLVVLVPALDRFFHTITPSVLDWILILIFSTLPFIAGELFKKLYHRQGK